MSNKLNVAIIGLCAFAAGLFAALLVASFRSETFVDAEQDRDRWKVRAESQAAEILALNNQVAKLKEETENLTKSGTGITKSWMKSQALIQMMIVDDHVRQLLSGPDFQTRFDPGWYAPANCYKLIGGRWLLEEMVEAGLLSEDDLEQLDSLAQAGAGPAEPSAEKRPFTWRVKDGVMETEVFRITSPQWKVSWRWISQQRLAQVIDPDFTVTVYRADGEIVTNLFNRVDESAVIRTSPGDFYLELGAFGGEVEFSVTGADYLSQAQPSGYFAGQPPKTAEQTVDPNMVYDLMEKGRILVNEDRREEWLAATVEVRAAGCLAFSQDKVPDLTMEQHVVMARRLRNTVDDWCKKLPDNMASVREILALTLTLDGQEWLRELRSER